MGLTELETVWGPRALGLLRIVAALLFMEHGAQKLLGFPPSRSSRCRSCSRCCGLRDFLELVGGFFVLIGLFTRPVAFILSGEMAFAYWMAHAPNSFFPALNGGDAAILFCFIFLYLAVAGPGASASTGRAARRQRLERQTRGKPNLNSAPPLLTWMQPTDLYSQTWPNRWQIKRFLRRGLRGLIER